MCEVDRAIPNTEAWYVTHAGAFEDLVHDHAHDKRSGKSHLENEELRPFFRPDRTQKVAYVEKRQLRETSNRSAACTFASA